MTSNSLQAATTNRETIVVKKESLTTKLNSTAPDPLRSKCTAVNKGSSSEHKDLPSVRGVDSMRPTTEIQHAAATQTKAAKKEIVPVVDVDDVDKSELIVPTKHVKICAAVDVHDAVPTTTTDSSTKKTNHITASIELANTIKQEIETLKPSFGGATMTTSILPPIILEQRKPEAGSIFIKKDYLPSPCKPQLKIEKTREEVTRILNFGSSNTLSGSEEPTTTTPIKVDVAIKDVSVAEQQPPPPPSIGSSPAASCSSAATTPPSESENKENASNKIEIKVNYLTGKKTDITDHGGGGGGAAAAPKSAHNKSSSSLTTSTIVTSKEYNKSSSSRRSSSSSNRECSRCYKRSKIKRNSVGIQCRRQSHQAAVAMATVGDGSTVSVAAAATAKPAAMRHCMIGGGVGSAAAALPPVARGVGLKYERYFHVEVHSNGGASVVHMYQDEIDALGKDEMNELVDEFFQVAFSEDGDGNAHHVMGIVHDAAAYLPDLLEHMSENYSTLTVKAGVMGRNSDIETSTMYQYNEQVSRSTLLISNLFLRRIIYS